MEIHTQEHPQSRCLTSGPDSLTFRECLTLLLSSKHRAYHLLQIPGKGLSPEEQERAFFIALESPPSDFLNFLNPSQKARLLAAFELGKRYTLFRYTFDRMLSQDRSFSQLATQSLLQVPPALRIEPKEWLGFVAVRRNHDLSPFCLIERGVRTHVNTDPTEIFARILALRPLGFFLFHNHPSGNRMPSMEDYDLTERVHHLAGLLGLQLFGHWIVTPQSERLILSRPKS